MARARRRRAAGPAYLDGHAEVVESLPSGTFQRGTRIFHRKFGYGTVAKVDGDRLDIEFDKAGKKKVISSFVVLEDQAG
jgi:DNA helicase-2/ATP-dependent DNA helicase PcrA